MGYLALIDANLNRAFNLAKDLAVDVTLTKQTNVGFDFSSATTTGTPTTLTAKGIIVEKKKTSKETNSVSTQLMLKSREVGDLTQFDTVQIGATTYRVGSVLKSNGHITLVELDKGV